MGKITNIAIEYYEDNYDLEELYENFLSLDSIKFFENDYFLVDYTPVKFKLGLNESVKDVLVKAIKKYTEEPLVFSVELDGMITHHTFNAVRRSQINIAIATPKMIEGLKTPDFSYYLERLLPCFMKYEIQSIECSYG